MKRKMIRCALLGAVALLAASCFGKNDFRNEYDAHLLVKFEPDYDYEWDEFLNKLFNDFVFDILGLVESNASDGSGALVDGLMQTIIDIRKQARANKDWATSDKIRDELAKLHITLKDGKEGTSWIME